MKISEEEIKQTKLQYRKTLNIPQTIFGIEIEFVDALLKQVEEAIKEFNLTDKTQYPKLPAYYANLKDYTKWKCVNEASTQYIDEIGNIFGGEINSPLLCNTEECFESLKKICSILKSIKNMKTNFRCALNIHVDRTIYGNDAKTFLNLLKLYMLYEDIIYKFGFGKQKYGRSYIPMFAAPISKTIYDNLEELNNQENESFDKIIKKFKKKHLGLSFYHTEKSYQAISNTIEARMFNGTTDEIIIQNNINMLINLLQYVIRKYDEELIEHKIKTFAPIEYRNFAITNLEKAEELADLIFEDELDKIYFLKQYLKLFDQELEKQKQI